MLRLSKPAHGEGWELGEGRTVKDDIDLRYDGGMDVDFEVTEDGQGVFSGELAWCWRLTHRAVPPLSCCWVWNSRCGELNRH